MSFSTRYLGTDLRFALRGVRRNPGFAAAVLLTLGLGIGVCTAVFGVTNALLLRPLPFPEPDRLVHVWGTDERQGWNQLYVSGLDYFDLAGRVEAFAAVGGFYNREVNLSGSGGQPERVAIARLTPSAFTVLGVEPARGRAFTLAEERGEARVAVLADGIWRRRFAADEAVLGRSILLNAEPYTVVGVMPPGFSFPMPTTQVWIPTHLQPAAAEREGRLLQVVARLRPPASLEQSQAQLAALAAALASEEPESRRGFGFRAVPLRGALVFSYDRIRLISWILAAAVACTLLLVCANVANLMLARFAARVQEVAIRNALGADRRRLVQQFLTESVVLSLLGGAFGLVIASWVMRSAAVSVPDNIYRVGEFGVSAPTLAVALGLSLVTALLVGLLPALQVVRSGAAGDLQERAGRGRRGRRRFAVLVVTQLAVGTVLLVGALLMIRSVEALRRVDPGFRTADVLSLKLTLPKTTYPADADLGRFIRTVRHELEQLPGVHTVAAVNFLPLNHELYWQSLRIEGAAAGGDREPPSAIAFFVTPGYFETLGVPLVRGRGVEESDLLSATPVAVVNRDFVTRYSPDRDVLGTRIALGETSDEATEWRTVVGVVEDFRQADLQGAARPQVFVPYDQRPWSYLRLLVRAETPPLELVPAVRSTLAALDPDLPLTEVRTLDSVLVASLAIERSITAGLAGLGVGALLLAAVGLYGVMSFRVMRGYHEIGMRMALGAERRSVVGMVMLQAARLTGVGLGIGLAVAAGGSLALARLLYGVRPLDPATFTAVAALLGLVALVAGLVPALRASRISPIDALRYD